MFNSLGPQYLSPAVYRKGEISPSDFDEQSVFPDCLIADHPFHQHVDVEIYHQLSNHDKAFAGFRHLVLGKSFCLNGSW